MPVALWSDWHWAEVVEAAMVNFVIAYELKIARARVRTLVQKIISLAKYHQVGAKYPGIVVCLGGDMLSGDIHEELSQTNEVAMAPAFVDLFGVLVWALTTLAEEFGRVFVVCVAGNHTRTTTRSTYKDSVHKTWDWLLGTMLERHFANDKRFAFLVPNNSDAHFEVAGHRFLLTHGNNLGVAGGDGIIEALGLIIRGDVKARRQSDSVGLGYETLLLGHWHQSVPIVPRVVVNGCLVGYSEYAKDRLRAPYEPPSQTMLMVHPSVGIVAPWVICLEPTGRNLKRPAWVSWPDQKA